MKIKRIQISGFRGIPPVNIPNNVDIDLTDPSSPNEPKDLLLFGPNAYGKSSIADALEWFFKESVRNSTYFEEYSAKDNVHMKLGEPGFNPTAFIELTVTHNGNDHNVRKELDVNGVKTNENLAGLNTELQKASDEIVVLDYELFHKFVMSANKEKWGSFSSLIGYEELDHLRGGLDSLTGNSLTTYLGTERLRREIDAERGKLQVDLTAACQQYGCSQISVEELENEFGSRLETNLASLSLEFPEIEAIDQAYWDALLERVKTPNDIVQAAERLSKLESQKDKLAAFDDPAWAEKFNVLETLSQGLSPKKSNFDKELLAVFYQNGLKVLSEKKTALNYCPLCDQAYDSQLLEQHVIGKHIALHFNDIQSEAVSLKDAWDSIKAVLKNREPDLLRLEQTLVQASFRKVADFSKMEKAISLSEFDFDYISDWLTNVKKLSEEVDRARQVVELEIPQARTASSNPNAEIQETVNDLLRFWTSFVNLSGRKREIERLERKWSISREITSGLQNVARQFRLELNDFSGRVATLINCDVQNYYRELHPEDDVVPSLDVSVVGSQRQVSLKCIYKGIPDKTAVPLLSESHRNSLGMAILLSFVKYKRQTGSPIEFCIFDDVMQSFDMEHRTNLLGLLENPNFPEICNQQIIFLTHDRTLADLIKRPGEQSVRDHWLRVDIRNWWIDRMLLESENALDPLQRARYYITQNDEIAAGIYVRRALEQIYKTILDRLSIRVPFANKPWSIGMDDYRKYILEEITELWNDNKGFIDPGQPLFQAIFTAQRILNLTVHDSHFLDTPMTLGEVTTALSLVEQVRDRFKCPSCQKYFHTLKKDNGNNPVCKGRGCNTTLA